MKWFFLFFGLFLFVTGTGLSAQETILLDWDIDSIFAEEPQESPEDEATPDTDEITVIQMLNRRSLTFGASYSFSSSIYPGWKEPPWNSIGKEDENYSNRNTFAWTPIVKVRTSFDLDAQISRVFGVKSTFYFTIPDSVSYFRFFLRDFFFDYNLFDTAFIRGGKYNLKWGISPNYGFTNLLARVPKNIPSHDSFILKADIPTGVGGFQFLALTRSDLTGGTRINRRNIGVGGKFNLAHRKFDLDAGAFYHYEMPLRLFLSVKTTFRNTELYSEGLAAFDIRKDDEYIEAEGSPGSSGAFNFGFARDFLNDKLSVNGELFYNTEGNSFFFSPRTDFEDSKISPFISGLNIALNILYRFEGRGNPRFFFRTLYATQENSAQLTPGIRINLWSHIELYFAVPMTLGSREGYYYTNPVIFDRENNPRRFAVILLLTLSGNLRYTHYF